MANSPVKISQLNSYIGKILSSDIVLSDVVVVGEVSNLNYHSTGHVYFTLKDEKSQIKCFLSSRNNENIRYLMENGMEIIARGYVNVFEKGGYYSLNIVDIKPSGDGNLNIAFAKLKEKLEKEGLFKSEHKKAIPTFPKNIMIVTSVTGAAVQDIKKIILSKNKYVNIYILPVIVQGERAAKDIANAIEEANLNYPYIDTMIVGRGGGSVEELWAFNEEVVIRAIYNSDIPIISAVGHETDISLSDLVADLRAETPTAAAALAVPDTNDLFSNLEYYKENLKMNISRTINNKSDLLKRFNIENLNGNILRDIKIREIKTETLLLNIKREIENKVLELETKLLNEKIQLEGLNPNKILNRGYSITADENGIAINSVSNIKIDDNLKIILSDGTINVKTVSIENK